MPCRQHPSRVICSRSGFVIAGEPVPSERIPSRMWTAGSPLLSRARQVGPHAFVELSLFPSDPVLEAAVPPLKTPFQAQTFCPEYHHCRRLQTVLDARMVRAFTTQVRHVWMRWAGCAQSQRPAASAACQMVSSQLWPHNQPHVCVMLGCRAAAVAACKRCLHVIPWLCAYCCLCHYCRQLQTVLDAIRVQPQPLDWCLAHAAWRCADNARSCW